MLKINKQDGFGSFIEVVITAIIFVVAAFGIYTSISMFRPQAKETETRLYVAYVAKTLLTDLLTNVDANSWYDTNGLLTPDILRSDIFGTYTVNYFLEDVPGEPVRKLTMNISY